MSDLKTILARVAQLDEGLAQELARHLERAGHRDEWVHDPDENIRLRASHGQIITMVYESVGADMPLSIADAHDIAANALRETRGLFYPEALSNSIDKQVEQRLRALVQDNEARINTLRTRISFETTVDVERDPDPRRFGLLLRAAGLRRGDHE